jgi:hypothetical protein
MWNGTYPLRCTAATFSLADRKRPPVRSFSRKPGLEPELDSIDALLREDATNARIERRLAREQRKLRGVSSDAAWAQYLRVEAIHMDRSLRWLELGAAWGARKRGRQRAR